MQEFAFQLMPKPPVGLRPDARALHREQFLVNAKNVRGNQYGLEDYESPNDPFDGGEAVSWPNPQIFRGEAQTLLLGDTSLKEVDETPDPWNTVPVTTYDPTDPSATKAIVSGGEWHVAELKNSFYAFNGSCTMFRVGVESLQGLSTKTFVQNGVTIKTGCTHRGRVIFGGFSVGDFWDSFWQDILTKWQQQVSGGGFETSFSDIGANWVFWSSIGGGDFPLWLFYPSLYYPTDTAPSAARFIEHLKRNELGWMPMPFQGTVLNIKPLGQSVVVYGEDGVAALIPFQGGVRDDIPPTFGLRPLTPFGINQRGAVGASPTRQIFIDKAGTLWSIDDRLAVSRLGYEEYLSPMTAETIRITFDEHENDFRICSDSYGFTFNAQGLYSHYQRVTSVAYVNGELVGLFTNEAGATADDVDIVTDPFDMSIIGLKSITHVGLDVRATNPVFIAIDYRYERTDAWARTKWVQVNKEGNTRCQAAGIEFRVAVKTDGHTDFEIDWMNVRWQKDDRRATRGPDADPSVTGTS